MIITVKSYSPSGGVGVTSQLTFATHVDIAYN